MDTAFFKALFKDHPNPILLLAKDRCIWANPAFDRLLDLSDAPLTPNGSIFDLILPQSAGNILSFITADETMFSSGREVEIHWVHGQGHAVKTQCRLTSFSLEKRDCWILSVQPGLEILKKTRQKTASLFKPNDGGVGSNGSADPLAGHFTAIPIGSGFMELYRFGDLVGKSQPMREIYEQILRAAKTDASVLITGESGTGKELVAKAIHDSSYRSAGDYVPVNCGAIPESLAESEFFGFRKGAFTGAIMDKSGYFAAAHKGTLFLDEIGDIDPKIQVKLLRVLESGQYIPLGQAKPRTTDVRFIAATHRDLDHLLRQGRLRKDFYYRIDVVHIRIPPLRRRKEDIPLLVEHFFKTLGGKGRHFPGRLLDRLLSHDWPGNVRELRSAIQRFIVLGNLDLETRPGENPAHDPFVVESRYKTLALALDEFQRRFIRRALIRNRWRKGDTALELGMDPKTLYRKIKKFGLNSPKSGQF